MDSVVRTAASLATEAGRLSQMLTTQIVERTKEVGVPAHLYDTAEERTADIIPGLDSKFDKEKLDALKRLIALMSKGRHLPDFFPHVIKNVAAQSFEVRKLVYIYLLRYADEQPDLALLSINTFQKVPTIAPLISLALRKGVSDLSPYVRKATANAVPKCYSLDPTHREGLIEIIQQLLNDKSTMVLGTAVGAVNRVCPDRYDLIHQHFRKLCRLVVECDEWGQLEILDLLLRYIRTHFVEPPRIPGSPVRGSGKRTVSAAVLAAQIESLDPDHALYIRSIRPLLLSRNPAVVISVASALHYTAPAGEMNHAARHLVRLVRFSRQYQYAALVVILALVQIHPTAFAPHASHFVVFDTESAEIQDLKLEILEWIASESNMGLVLGELCAYVVSMDERLCVRAVQVLGRLASRHPYVSEQCLQVLAALVSEQSPVIVGEAIIVLRQLLQVQPDAAVSDTNQQPTNSSVLQRHGIVTHTNTATQHNTLIRHLFKSYAHISVPMAKASVLWLIGHNVATLTRTAPDALRISITTFTSEAPIVKLQILNLAAHIALDTERRLVSTTTKELVSQHGDDVMPSVRETIRLCFEYALTLARFDVNYDIRDRGRFLMALVYVPVYGSPTKTTTLTSASTTLSALEPPNRIVFLDRLIRIMSRSQGVSKPPDPFGHLLRYRIGTLSQAVGGSMSTTTTVTKHTTTMAIPNTETTTTSAIVVDGYTDIPQWSTTPSDATLRNVSDSHQHWHRDRLVVGDGVKEVRVGTKMKKRVVALDEFLNGGGGGDVGGRGGGLDGLRVGDAGSAGQGRGQTMVAGAGNGASVVDDAVRGLAALSGRGVVGAPTGVDVGGRRVKDDDEKEDDEDDSDEEDDEDGSDDSDDDDDDDEDDEDADDNSTPPPETHERVTASAV